MSKRIQKKDLFHILSARPNFGCPAELGRMGTLLRFGRARIAGRVIYKVGVDFPDASPLFINLSREDAQHRGLAGHPLAIAKGAPVFKMAEGTPWSSVGVIFLRHPDEVMLLLRINLAYLQRRTDAQAERLYRELMGLSARQIPAPAELCLALIDLRDASGETFLHVFERVPDRGHALAAADRGEVLKMLNRCGRMASQLVDREVRMLRNVVRAHYFLTLRDMLCSGAALSPLGEKVFHYGGGMEFSRGEKQALLLLSISVATGRKATEPGPVGSRYLFGRAKAKPAPPAKK